MNTYLSGKINTRRDRFFSSCRGAFMVMPVCAALAFQPLDRPCRSPGREPTQPVYLTATFAVRPPALTM